MKAKFAILILVFLFTLTACNGAAPISSTAAPNPTASGSSTRAPSATRAPSSTAAASDADMEVDNSETTLEVTYQEYSMNEIVEILHFSYDGQQEAFKDYNWRNPEIEMMNNLIDAGPVKFYEDFINGEFDEDYADSIDMRSYVFNGGDLLQLVTTSSISPSVRPDLYENIWSFNYNMQTNVFYQVGDMLDDYNLTQADVEQRVKDLYEPSYDETISSVETVAFVINRTPARPVTHFLCKALVEYESDPVVTFFMYTPENDELEEPDFFMMFDPDRFEMAEFDPPLRYEFMKDGTSFYDDASPLRMTIGTYDLDMQDEDNYSYDDMVWVEIYQFDPPSDGYAYTENTLKDRIRYLERNYDRVEFLSLEPVTENYYQMSYPAWRADYLVGGNEDTMHCTDIFINTDTDEFRLHVFVSADWLEEYENIVERIISTVSLD